MTKQIWIICAISTFDSWKTSRKEVLLAESSVEEANKTCKRLDKQVKNETYIKGYEVRYIYEEITLYY